MTLRVAVVHDYLTQRGGAERVALAIKQAFPDARMITSVYHPDGTFPEFADMDIETSWLQKVPAFRRDPRLALPLLRRTFAGMRVDDVDVVICSSSGWAHAVPTDAAKLVYCHNPARWLYQPDEYASNLAAPIRAALRRLTPGLVAWDQAAARSATRYLVNSTTVRERVRATYGIQADLLPPPVGIETAGRSEPVPGVAPGFFLVVSRARSYKNVQVACEAFRTMPDQRLLVVGGLPKAGRPWPPNISSLERVPDSQLRWLYASCRAVIAVSYEDFGLTPLEGNAFGVPALVLRAGGFLDTLDEGVSGLFVESLSPDDVCAAVRTSLELSLDVLEILQHASHYSREAFEGELVREVGIALLQHSADRRGRDRRMVQLPLPRGFVDRRGVERRGVTGARWPRQRAAPTLPQPDDVESLP